MLQRTKRPDAHIAFLRGINVGGRNVLPMKDLAALFVGCGCGEVKTYIQSGNVVYTARPTLARKLPHAIEDAILNGFGRPVRVVIRTAQELCDVAADNPFLKAGVNADVLHMGFLADAPSAHCLSALDPHRSPPDEFVVRGRDIYFCLPNGVARTKLTNSYFDAKLGTTMTVRNWRTVLALVELGNR